MTAEERISALEAEIQRLSQLHRDTALELHQILAAKDKQIAKLELELSAFRSANSVEI